MDNKQLTATKQALLAKRLREARDRAAQARDAQIGERDGYNAGGEAPTPATIRPRRWPDGPLPASFAQQRVWFQEQLAPGLATYHIPVALRLSGPLDVTALEHSLQEVVQRHASLRTTFTAGTVVEHQPHQVVHPQMDVQLPVTHLSDIPVAERQEQALKYIRAEVQRPFDLEAGPLLRAHLFHLQEGEHILLLTLHHLVGDDASLGVLFRELSALYTGKVQGSATALPPLPIQYPDFTLWQRERMRGARLQEHLDYWKAHLHHGALPVLELPTDHPRPAIMQYQGDTYTFTLPEGLARGLRALARSESVTLFMLLLAAFSTLLARYTGQKEVVVGTVTSNREQPELENLIGFFVNTLALRVPVDGQATFREVLRAVRDITLGAYEHQALPFERLVEALRPTRDLSRSPLFQVMFIMQNAPVEQEFDLPGVTAVPLAVDTATSQFDLTLEIWETEDRIAGRFEYNTHLFNADTIQRMAGHYEILLRGITTASTSQATSRVAYLPLLTAGEKSALAKSNATTAPYPAKKGYAQLFAEQAARTPHHVALLYQGNEITYQELADRAKKLAHYLRAVGVTAETPVALYLPRTPEMVVALLAVLQAGGAYLPLDPLYPRERIRFMLEDAQVPVLLTVSGFLQESFVEETLPQINEAQTRVVCLDKLADSETLAEANHLPGPIAPESLAYVIYTSGSTGRPKGVMVTQRGLVNYVQWAAHTYAMAEGQGVPVHSPLSFDLTVTSLLAPLTVGQTVMLLEEKPAGEALSETLRRYRDLTLVKLTPSHLELLAQQLSPTEVAGRVRAFIIGGEALLEEHLAFWQASAPATRLVNEYGPTETVVGCVVYEVPRTEGPASTSGGAVPIGRPIANTRAYVLDAALEPVPAGVPGELYIGGAGVARGYLARPALTAERFLPDPFAEEPGARMYRTGDLVYYRIPQPANGEQPPALVLEYLGRQDHQVKIRGYRVELGEIEAVLREHPLVRQGAVVARPQVHSNSNNGHRELVAYVVPEEDFDVKKLRHDLGQTLPAYMVPAAFSLLGALPLTPNGKVDYRALPEPDTLRLEEVAYVAPRTPLEETLARIWAEVLDVSQVGVNDNFFTLGGHSLQVAQLASRLTTALERDVPIKSLFLYPTPAQLADTLEQETSLQPAPQPGPQEVPPEAQETDSASRLDHVRHKAAGLQIERRPLLSLFAIGELAPVDAAAFGYLDQLNPELDARLRRWSAGLPVFTDVITTPLGRIAVILLPTFDTELYSDQEGLVETALAALRMAKHLGARMVSLTGLIPSATDYAHAIAKHPAYDEELPRITTGHATTTAVVALTAKRLFALSRRDVRHEHVGVLGLGSIGLTSLKLMLRTLPHPERLLLCDLYSKRDALEEIRRELIHRFGFHGKIEIITATTKVPAAFYDATFILGATNAPDVLDVQRLQPGTLLVDDSSPHCFDVTQAVRRFEKRGDILFTEGGVVRSRETLHEISYVPENLEAFFSRFWRRNAYDITGCILSSLLSLRFPELRPTLGIVQAEESLKHYRKLTELEYRAANLHCDGYAPEWQEILAFQRQFGGTRR